jgi:outer membrane protein OmpA-like peptidoglycan-associated protein
MHGTPDIAQLRNLLFGTDYDALLALKAQLEDSEQYSERVASVIAEAIQRRNAKDGAVSAVLAPTVEQAISYSISNDPQHFADVLYPVMGPAIRKSIQQALNEALANFNHVLEQSLSVRSWKWRFDAWRTGKSYAEIALLRTLIYQVEQVFLIHRNTGLLLQHVVSENVAGKDPEIVSAMLTAIQDFIQDSFAGEGNSNLETLRLGELTVLIEHGPHAVLAMVVRGNPPSELRTLLVETSEAIHQQYRLALQDYQGDASAFASIEPLLHDCLVKKHKIKEKRPPWLAYALLLTLVGAGAWWAYQYQQSQAQQAVQLTVAEKTQQDTVQALTQQLQQQQTQQAALQATLQTLLDAQATAKQQQTQQQSRNAASIASLRTQIESASYTFDKATNAINANDPKVTALSQHIRDLLQATQQADQTLQITIVGNVDASGSETTNQSIAQQRADNMRKALINTGIPAFTLVAYGAKQTDVPTAMQKNERSTRYQVSVY